MEELHSLIPFNDILIISSAHHGTRHGTGLCTGSNQYDPQNLFPRLLYIRYYPCCANDTHCTGKRISEWRNNNSFGTKATRNGQRCAGGSSQILIVRGSFVVAEEGEQRYGCTTSRNGRRGVGSYTCIPTRFDERIFTLLLWYDRPLLYLHHVTFGHSKDILQTLGRRRILVSASECTIRCDGTFVHSQYECNYFGCSSPSRRRVPSPAPRSRKYRVYSTRVSCGYHWTHVRKSSRRGKFSNGICRIR